MSKIDKEKNFVSEKNITIIDKINDTIDTFNSSLIFVIDPAGEIYYLKDYQIKNKRMFGIIHKKDGSTLFCYENDFDGDKVSSYKEKDLKMYGVIKEGGRDRK